MDFRSNNKLVEQFHLTPPFNLEDFFARIIKYCHTNINFDKGIAFVLNGGTNRFEQLVPAPGSTVPNSIAVHEGIAEHAVRKKKAVYIPASKLGKADIPVSIRPSKNITALLLIPLFEFNQPTALLLFYLKSGEDGTLTEQNEKTAFFKQFEDPQFRMVLHQVRIRQIQNDLWAAGDASKNLRTALQKFITTFLKQFDDSGWKTPAHCYIQLVDRPGNNIRTVLGHGMPLSFGFMQAHSLEDKDIQADIVRNPHFEIIAGNDLERFDQDIFEKYNHKQYVRLWMPLFPLPLSDILETNTGNIDMLLEKRIHWHSEKKSPDCLMKSLSADWSGKEQISTRLVFGTFEIGYLAEEQDRISLMPWTKGLAMWCIARAYELVPELFKVTMPGVLEQLGQRLASVTWPDKMNLLYHFPDSRRTVAVRTYPIPGNASVALPHRDTRPIPSLRNTLESKPISFDHRLVSLEYPEQQNPETLPHSFQQLQEINTSIAGEAADVATRMINTILAPQELHLSKDDDSYIGPLRRDNVVMAVCKEAARASGAESCYCVFFEKYSSENIPEKKIQGEDSNPSYIGPPALWGKDYIKETVWEKAQEKARAVARDNYSQYIQAKALDANFARPIILLPLELSDGTTGILILALHEHYNHTDENLFDLEARIPGWVYRLSARRLYLKNQFIERISQVRRGIAKARERAFRNTNNKSQVTAFIDEALVETVTIQSESQMGLITLYSETTTDRRRVERFFYWNDGKSQLEPLVDHFDFIDRPLSGPCGEACEYHKTVIFDDPSKCEGIQVIIGELEDKSRLKQNMGELDCAKRLQKYADSLRGSSGKPSTIITLPLMRSGENEDNSKAAYTIVLNHKHYYDNIHRRSYLEFGEYFAEILDQVKKNEQQTLEDRFHDCLENLRKRFVSAETVDDLVGSFLSALSVEKDGNQHANITDRLGLSEDVVFWSLGEGGDELILRSARGHAGDALSNHPGCCVIDPKLHPYILRQHENKNLISPRKDSARLKEATQAFLQNFPLEACDNSASQFDVCQAYAESTQKKWMVTFPIIDATNRIIGVVDCLRDDPLEIVETKVLERLLWRVSSQFCTTMESRLHDMSNTISKELFEQVEQFIRFFQVNKAYQALVGRMKEAFNSKICDLFLESNGRIVLYTTTRDVKCLEDNRTLFWLKPDSTNTELLGKCLHSGQIVFQHSDMENAPVDHISPNLQELLSNELSPERMAIPLKAKLEEGKEVVVGLLHLQEPQETYEERKHDKRRRLKKSIYFTAESARLGSDLGLSAQRIIQMIRIVETQSWLANEISHSMGQPLQALRDASTTVIRALFKTDTGKLNDIRKLDEDIDICFDFVHEAKDQLGFLAKLGQSTTYTFEESDLWQIVQDCCNLMDDRVRQKRCRIDRTDVRPIQPLPLVKPWIRKAILNLIDNAWKYSWSREVIFVRADEDAMGNIKIEVRNHGIGIPLGSRERIFDPYFRYKVKDAKGERLGTGSGLAIAKYAVCDIHNGKITFDSAPTFKGAGIKRDTIEDIKDILHETSFSIHLNRKELIKLENPARNEDIL